MRPNRQSKQNHLVLHALQKFMILWQEKFVFSKQHHNFFPNSKGFILGTEVGWLLGCKSGSSVVVKVRKFRKQFVVIILNSFKTRTNST